jgi:peptidoglycan-associated lipoprotein
MAAIVAATVVVGVACGGPTYPSCDNDGQCNADGKHPETRVCLDHKCVECRDDAACGNGRACRAGRCEARVTECDDKNPCPGGAALASREPVACDDEHPCKGAGERCQNGHCVAPDQGGPGCRDFGSPSFEFDSLELSASTKATLQRLAGCVTTGSLKGRKVLLTGHCDPRGENEYNMGLGAQRSASAKDFLMSLGVGTEQVVTSSRGKLDAVGTDESGWVKDRRVDIEIR